MPDPTTSLFEYSSKAGVAVAWVFIMILLWKILTIFGDVFKDFVKNHFAHVEKLENNYNEMEKQANNTAKALADTISSLNGTIQLLNQSVKQIIDDFKSMHKEIAEIKQITSHCGERDRRD